MLKAGLPAVRHGLASWDDESDMLASCERVQQALCLA